MLRCVVFDMDGTLLDTEVLAVSDWQQAGRAFGYDIPDEFIIDYFGMNEASINRRYIDHFGKDFPISQVRAYRMEIGTRRLREEPVSVKPGAREILEYLKKKEVAIALATSTHYDKAFLGMKKAGLFDFFDGVATGEMVQRGKPEPDIFLKALQKVGCAPEDSIVVEDTENGAWGGIAAGCRTVMVPDLKQPGEEVRSRLYRCCDSLFDLAPLIDELL